MRGAGFCGAYSKPSIHAVSWFFSSHCSCFRRLFCGVLPAMFAGPLAERCGHYLLGTSLRGVLLLNTPDNELILMRNLLVGPAAEMASWLRASSCCMLLWRI